jgi:hypothetical protein
MELPVIQRIPLSAMLAAVEYQSTDIVSKENAPIPAWGADRIGAEDNDQLGSDRAKTKPWYSEQPVPSLSHSNFALHCPVLLQRAKYRYLRNTRSS